MFTLEVGHRYNEWRGWEGFEEGFEADEWATFEDKEEYLEEIENLKELGYIVYYENDRLIQLTLLPPL